MSDARAYYASIVAKGAAHNAVTMKTRSLKTILRDNGIHDAYNALIARGGEFATAVSRKFIYDKIAKCTGYSIRVVADVLNHTTYTKTTFFEE